MLTRSRQLYLWTFGESSSKTVQHPRSFQVLKEKKKKKEIHDDQIVPKKLLSPKK